LINFGDQTTTLTTTPRRQHKFKNEAKVVNRDKAFKYHRDLQFSHRPDVTARVFTDNRDLPEKMQLSTRNFITVTISIKISRNIS